MMTRKQLSDMASQDRLRLDWTQHGCTIMATVGFETPVLHVTGGDQTPEDEDKVIRCAIGAALRELRIQGERTR